jgi:hypothetical protein
MPAVLQPRRPEDFELLYEGRRRGSTGRPQPALLALAGAGAIRGRILDLADLGEQPEPSAGPSAHRPGPRARRDDLPT